MKKNQFGMWRFTFKPTLLGTLLTLIFIPLFIKFGLWQYHKAELKQAIQMAYNQATVDTAFKFPLEVIDVADWNYKKVSVTGVYETKYQFLLDNQVEANRVGYHVITPLKINETQYVLVNRGWILGKDIHSELPLFDTPVGVQAVTGQVWLPSKKFFSLENRKLDASQQQGFEPVWQHMDMGKYQRLVPLTVSPLVIKLDQDIVAGGFVRNWQVPTARIMTHIGYAYQWFGFAVATLLIYIYMSIFRVKSSPAQVDFNNQH
jgi:surfeit locus 1 family protein